MVKINLSFALILLFSFSRAALASERTISVRTTSGAMVEVTLNEVQKALRPNVPATRPAFQIGSDGRAIISWPQIQVAGVWMYVDAGYDDRRDQILCEFLGFRRTIGSQRSGLGLVISGTVGGQSVADLQTRDGGFKIALSNTDFVFSEIACEL